MLTGALFGALFAGVCACVYVWLQKPSTSIWSSETAAPVFSEVAEQTVILLNIPPDVVRSQIVNK